LNIVLFSNGRRGEVVHGALCQAGNTPVAWVDDSQNVNDPEFMVMLANLEPGLFIVAGFPQIFRKELIDIPVFGVWNCHAGPPGFAGGSPLNWQIIEGREKIGISLLRMDEGIDTGPVIASETFHLYSYETIADAHKKANKAFAGMVLGALRDFPPAETPQETVVYHKQRRDEDGEIDFSWPASRIRDFVRALSSPYPGAWFRAGDGKKVRIWSASAH